jgi:hypothetical protein
VPLATVSAASVAPEPVPLGAATAERLDWLQTPVLAALPTGLLSQRFAAQEPPIDAGAARTESVIVAAEIDLAAGTPGPQPYAHADLPAVLVSNTQLSAAPASASVAVEHPARSSEPAPVLVLPGASPSPARRKILVLGAVACALTIAAVVYAIARRDSPAQQIHLSSPVDDRMASGGSAANSTAQGTGQSAIAIAEPAHPPAEITARASIRPVNVAETGGGSAGPAAVAPRADDDAAAQLPPPPSHAVLAPAGARAAGTSEAVIHSETPIAEPPRSPSSRDASSGVQKTQQVASTKKTGELAVLVKPWALLWLNGKPMNQTPYRETIPAGRYRLRLKNDDLGKDESIVVTVSPDHTTIIERKW